MELIVLGRYGTFPARDGACSGYLIRQDTHQILLDCGNGVFSRLQGYCRLEDLDGIIISHLHDDHCGDLRILKYVIETKQVFGEIEKKMKVCLPATPKEVINELRCPEVFDLQFINNDSHLEIGGFHLSFAGMRHSIESYAIFIESSGQKIVYSGDTVFNEDLINLAIGADLFLCESTFASRNEKTEKTPHMTANEAGYIASQAGVKRLLLTHFWYEENIEACVKMAQRYFDNVSSAQENMSYYV